MSPDDIHQFKWNEFVGSKIGTRHWVVGRRLTRQQKRIGYQKAITPKMLDELREQFEAGRV